MEKKNLKKQKSTKAKIINAVIDLCENRPISSVTVNQICEKACIHRSTYYRYFETSEMMIREIKENFIKELDAVYGAIDFSNGLTKAGRKSFEDMMHFYDDHRRLANFLLFSMEDRSFYDKYAELIKRHISRMMEQCGLWFDEPYQEYFIDHQVGGIINCVREFLRGSYKNTQELIDFMYRFGVEDTRKIYIHRSKPYPHRLS